MWSGGTDAAGAAPTPNPGRASTPGRRSRSGNGTSGPIPAPHLSGYLRAVTSTDQRLEAREARRKNLEHRQTKVIGSIAAVMAVLALLGALNWAGILPSPFTREFSEEVKGVDALAVACPPADALPVPLNEITAAVYNAAGEEGLAGSRADVLTSYGVEVAAVGNWPEDSEVPTRLIAGPSGLTQAYTLARLFDGAIVTADERADPSVDIVLGVGHGEILAPHNVELLPQDEPFIAPEGCRGV